MQRRVPWKVACHLAFGPVEVDHAHSVRLRTFASNRAAERKPVTSDGNFDVIEHKIELCKRHAG